MKSILETERGECFLCGKYPTEEHHIFGGANRRNSEINGFKAFLCRSCHTGTPNGVHHNRKNNDMLKAVCQAEFEKTHTRQEFMDIIGKNYL